MTMLADDEAVEGVIFGDEGALDALPAGAVHCSLSTIGPALSERLAAAHRERGGGYVAAPVFGRPEAAEGRKLWVVAAGPADALDICAPLFDAIGQGTRRVGDAPATANVIELAGNFMIAAMIETLGEAFALVRRSGVDAAEFLELINALLFKSPIYQSYGALIAGERFEPAAFKLHLGLKDVRLALAAADSAGVPMPLGSLLHDNFLAAVGRGKGEIDWAGLAGLIAENAGLE
jgi:3-hydroxyisobutyrate dehydrogenase-like beta-hydroxyacid dehydrogenase